MNRNVSIIFAGLVVILIGGFLTSVFFFGNKNRAVAPVVEPVAQKVKSVETVDTADWSLYQNKKFGYEMKYPKGWEVTTLANVPAESFSAPSFENPNGGKIHPSLMINEIHTVEAGETIDTNLPSGAGDYTLIEKKKMKVDGKDAEFVEYFQKSYGRKNGKIGLVRQEIKVINGNTSYTFLIDEENEDIDVLNSSALWKNKATFEAMVGSFRFLGNTEQTNNASAQGIVYTNKEFGFSVSLPAGWEKYQVSIQKDKGDDKHTYIYFMMPTADKTGGTYDKNTGGTISGMASIFAITATDLATWNTDINSKECKENPNPSCPNDQSVVAKSSKYVFDASYGNGVLPTDVQKFMTAKSATLFLSGKFNLL